MIQPLGKGAVARLLTCHLKDPTGYGRVIRQGKWASVLKVVEEKDANAKEKQIQEVVASIYLFEPRFLSEGLRKISNRNAQGEYYLPDLVEQISKSKKKSEVLVWANPDVLRGVNDPWELAWADQMMNEILIRSWALKGVRFLDPRSTRVGADVILDLDITVHPGVILEGKTRVGSAAVLGPRVILKDTLVGANANLKAGTIAEASVIGESAQIGPYAHLRPESHVGARAKIGNFVELKKTTVGEASAIAHLSYLGDAECGCHPGGQCDSSISSPALLKPLGRTRSSLN